MNIRTFLVSLLACLLLVGCASGPDVIANKDPSANFQDYRTFAFMQPLSSDRGSARSIISTHLIAATSAEFESRGLVRDDTRPDLLINFFVGTEERVQVRNTPTTSASMSWRRGRYGTWPGYSMHMSTPTVTQTTEGTIRVDVVDAARNQLVWEGAASDRVTDSMRRDQEETVRDAITAIFAEFPR